MTYHRVFGLLSGNGKALELPLMIRYGRVDCVGSPRVKAEDFPNPRMGLEGVLSWCSRVFKLSKNECVVVIGEPLIWSKLMMSGSKGCD